MLAVVNDGSLLANLRAVAQTFDVPVEVVRCDHTGAYPPCDGLVVIYLDHDDVRAHLDSIFRRIEAGAEVVLVAGESTLAEKIAWMSEPRVNHIVDLNASSSALQVAVGKILSGDVFGIEKYLSPGVEVDYQRVFDLDDRTLAVDRVLAFASARGVRKRFLDSIGQVCEELLMNALYDAPVDEEGRVLFANIAPCDRGAMRSPRPVSIRYACNGDDFAVAVRDRFGRLDKETVLAYLHKCLNHSTQIDRKTHGAGLGLYLVANSAACIAVNVAEGVATEVICLFDTKRRSLLRDMSFFRHSDKVEPKSWVSSQSSTIRQ